MIKTNTLIILAFLLTTSLSAQETFKTLLSEPHTINFHKVVKKSESHFKSKHQGKTATELSYGEFRDGEFVKFERWKHFWKHRLMPNGDLADLSTKNTKVISKNALPGAYNNLEWKNITYKEDLGVQIGLGRTNAIGFHPSDPNTFYVGSANGGIWKTTDGGSSYVPLGDQLPFLSVSSIIVDKNNPDIIYIAISDRVWYGPSGIGVYKSINGGQTWNATSLSFSFGQNNRIYFMDVDPNDPQKMFVATQRGLYSTEDGFQTVDKIANGNISDVKFKPGSSSTIYYTNQSTGSFYRSQDGGSSFQQIMDWSGAGYLRIAVTAQNPEKVYVSLNNTLHKSTNGGTSFNSSSSLSLTRADGKAESINDGIVMISPTDENDLLVGNFEMFTSTNNGNNFTPITDWLGRNNLPLIHVDQRNAFINPLQSDRIYICNDGGVYSVNVNTNTFTNLSNGLIITQFYDIATSQSDSNVISGGSQDNGNVFRESNGEWVPAAPTADGMHQEIDPTNANIRYNSIQNGAIYRFVNGTRRRIDNNITEVKKSEWVTPYQLDPNNPSTIVAGYNRVYRSSNRGDSWISISPQLAGGSAMDYLAIAPSNSERIYAVENFGISTGNIFGTNPSKSEMYIKSTTSNRWSTIVLPTTQFVSDIAVDPEDADHVFISVSGYTDNEKVFESIDAGKTWKNISGTELPNVPAGAISFYKSSGSNPDALFLGTDNGVYFKEPSMSQWEKAGTFPSTHIMDMEIQKSAGIIRVGTHGRGILEADLNGTISNTCIAPQNVKTDNLAAKSVQLSWDAITGAKQYYTYHKSDSSDWVFTDAGTNLSQSISGLEPNTSYTIDVWVQCANDETKSTRITITTPEENVCTAPQNVKVSAITSNSITVNWNALPGAKQYYTYHRGGSLGWTKTDVGLNTSATLTNLQPNTTYTIDVWLQCANNEYKSTRIEGTTQANDPVQPGSVYQIVSTLPGQRILEVYGSAKRDEANVIMWWAYNGTSNRWKFNKLSNGNYVITPMHDQNRALDVYRGENRNGQNIQTYNRHNGNSQQWKLIPMGNDTYKLESITAPGKYLAVSAGVDKDGSNIIIWENTDKNGQIWRFKLEKDTKNLDPTLSSRDQTIVSPIPAIEQFTIDFKNTTDSKSGGKYIELINTLGKVVKKIKTNNNDISGNSVNVSTQELAPGAYILKIKNENGIHIYSQQIIIRR